MLGPQLWSCGHACCRFSTGSASCLMQAYSGLQSSCPLTAPSLLLLLCRPSECSGAIDFPPANHLERPNSAPALAGRLLSPPSLAACGAISLPLVVGPPARVRADAQQDYDIENASPPPVGAGLPAVHDDVCCMPQTRVPVCMNGRQLVSVRARACARTHVVAQVPWRTKFRVGQS